MFGSLRLLLAAMVALAHAGYSLGPWHLGVPAVVGFYLISGYVTTALIDRYHQGRGQVGAFYADRALRLLPQYYGYALIGALLWATATVHSPFLAAVPTGGDWLANVFIVPLNYFMLTGQDRFTLVPPAWSLGAEIQFYLLLPWLVVVGGRGQAVLGGLSLVVFALAQAGWLDADAFGYRLLPGILWIFLAGGLIYRQRAGSWRQGWMLLGLLGLAAWLWLAALWGWPELRRPFNVEVALGLSVGLPVVVALARWSPRRWDTAVGQLAYGVFLGHFAVLWWWPVLERGERVPPLAYLMVLMGVATLSYAGWERPLARWRRLHCRAACGCQTTK